MENVDKAAFLMSQSACAMITALGMQAENQQRAIEQSSPAFVGDDFQRVINDHRIGWNDAIGYLKG
jgi:hydroxymethylpyrimidine/phosphomethylpyrimidine kinase